MSYDVVQTTQFNAMLDIKEQQMTSRLLPYARRVQVTGDDFAYDGLDDVSAYYANGANARIQPTNVNFNRRKLSRNRIAVTLLVDRKNIRGMITDPQGELAAACIMAMEREVDRVIYAQMFASVSTGRDFSTTVTFAADGGLTVDATSGLVYEEFLEVIQNFMDSEVAIDGNRRVCMGITGDEHTDLMGESEITSGDYSRQYVVDRGVVKQAVGIELIPFGASVTNPILQVDTNPYRVSFAMVDGAMVFGSSRERTLEIKDHPDYVESYVVHVVMECGSVRTRGSRIQKVNLTP